MKEEELIKSAIEAKNNAYVPYSNFRVGAALLTESGRVFTGSNIENVSFGATVCAERTAAFKAVSEGEKLFIAIAVASDDDKMIFPCGICRQVLVEFGRKDMKVICTRKTGEYNTYRLFELLPNAFIEIGGDK